MELPNLPTLVAIPSEWVSERESSNLRQLNLFLCQRSASSSACSSLRACLSSFTLTYLVSEEGLLCRSVLAESNDFLAASIFLEEWPWEAVHIFAHCFTLLHVCVCCSLKRELPQMEEERLVLENREGFKVFLLQPWLTLNGLLPLGMEWKRIESRHGHLYPLL